MAYQYVVIEGQEYPVQNGAEFDVAGRAMEKARLARAVVFSRDNQEADASTGVNTGNEITSRMAIADIVKLKCTHQNRAFAGIGNLVVDQYEDAARGVLYQVDHERKKFRRTGMNLDPWPEWWEQDAR